MSLSNFRLNLEGRGMYSSRRSLGLIHRCDHFVLKQPALFEMDIRDELKKKLCRNRKPILVIS